MISDFSAILQYKQKTLKRLDNVYYNNKFYPQLVIRDDVKLLLSNVCQFRKFDSKISIFIRYIKGSCDCCLVFPSLTNFRITFAEIQIYHQF